MDIIWTKRRAGTYDFLYGGRSSAWITHYVCGADASKWQWCVPQANVWGKASTFAEAKVAAEAAIRKYVGDR